MEGDFHFCEYEHWNRETKVMEVCGEDTDIELSVRGLTVHLCAEHRDFVMDNTTGPYSKSPKHRHPADYDWTAMCLKSYGAITFAQFMGLLPTDAGQNYVSGKPVNTRRISSLRREPTSKKPETIINFNRPSFDADHTALLALINKEDQIYA